MNKYDEQIIKAAKQKLVQAEQAVTHWKQFLKACAVIQAEVPEDSGYNKLPKRHAHLQVATIQQCICLLGAEILSNGPISSVSAILDMLALHGYTFKPRSLSSCLSQSDEFIFDKSKGGWLLSK